jgi:hypothetical protein
MASLKIQPVQEKMSQIDAILKGRFLNYVYQVSKHPDGSITLYAVMKGILYDVERILEKEGLLM